MTIYRIIYTAADVDDGILADALSTLDWFEDGARIDWEEFIDRLAGCGNVADDPYDFEEYDSPAVRKIQAYIRKVRAEG